MTASRQSIAYLLCAALTAAGVGAGVLAHRLWDVRNDIERLAAQLTCEIVELPLGTAAGELAVIDRADAGAVIAAVLKALEAIEQPLRDQRFPDNRNDPAHMPSVTQILRTMPSNIHCRRNGARSQALLWHG